LACAAEVVEILVGAAVLNLVAETLARLWVPVVVLVAFRTLGVFVAVETVASTVIGVVEVDFWVAVVLLHPALTSTRDVLHLVRVEVLGKGPLAPAAAVAIAEVVSSRLLSDGPWSVRRRHLQDLEGVSDGLGGLAGEVFAGTAAGASGEANAGGEVEGVRFAGQLEFHRRVFHLARGRAGHLGIGKGAP